MGRLNVGVLISGRGSNLEALIGECGRPGHPARIAAVVSNVADAPGLQAAAQHGIGTAVVDHRLHADRASFDAALDRELRSHGVDFVCLAGFMRLLTADFVETWRDRLINVHPSLLPAFKGRHPQRQALEAGARISGCTVHHVRPEMDSGPIIAQAAVPVLPGDDENSLSRRILAAEHRLYPTVVRLIAEGRISIANERVDMDREATETLRALDGIAS
mgnify:CR=1 FL=1